MLSGVLSSRSASKPGSIVCACRRLRTKRPVAIEEENRKRDFSDDQRVLEAKPARAFVGDERFVLEPHDEATPRGPKRRSEPEQDAR